MSRITMEERIETPEEILKIIREPSKKKLIVPRKKKDYVKIKVNNFSKMEHRHIWEKHNGKIHKGMIVHHINHNKRDNRIENLQLVSFVEHMKIHKGEKKEKWQI